MHSELIKKATHEQLADFTKNALSMIKETNKDLYDTLELYLYKEIYGCHFSEWLNDRAVSKLQNADGSIGRHWSVEQTTNVAKAHNIDFIEFNEYDWNFVMNLVYSDYFGAVPNDVQNYVKLAKAFLNDKDAPMGKAFMYYYNLMR
jgi:hypothetical protein